MRGTVAIVAALIMPMHLACAATTAASAAKDVIADIRWPVRPFNLLENVKTCIDHDIFLDGDKVDDASLRTIFGAKTLSHGGGTGNETFLALSDFATINVPNRAGNWAMEGMEATIVWGADGPGSAVIRLHFLAQHDANYEAVTRLFAVEWRQVNYPPSPHRTPPSQMGQYGYRHLVYEGIEHGVILHYALDFDAAGLLEFATFAATRQAPVLKAVHITAALSN